MKRCALIVLVCFLCFLKVNAQSEPPGDSLVSEDGAFTKVDIDADFIGGLQGWRKFLEKNLNANVPVDNGAPIGMYTVLVQFVVGKDGTVTDVKALTKEGFGMEQEVLRLMKTAGKWTPAMVNGKPVKAYRKQPVIFAVTQDDVEVVTKVPYVLFTDTDNEVVINVEGVKYKDLDVSISAGTITRSSENGFVAVVNKPGRVTLTVNNIKKKKSICQISLQVRKKL